MAAVWKKPLVFVLCFFFNEQKKMFDAKNRFLMAPSKLNFGSIAQRFESVHPVETEEHRASLKIIFPTKRLYSLTLLNTEAFFFLSRKKFMRVSHVARKGLSAKCDPSASVTCRQTATRKLWKNAKYRNSCHHESELYT